MPRSGATLVNSLMKEQSVFIKGVAASGAGLGETVGAGYQQRKLNTLENPSSFTWVSLTSNQFTLAAGTYEFDGSAPARGENDLETVHKAKLYNVTDAADAIIGTAEYSSLLVVGATAGGSPTQTRCVMRGKLVLAASKTFEIRHQIQNTGSGTSFGTPSAFGESEVYCVMKITKVK